MSYVDFAELKTRVSIEQVLEMLGFINFQRRGEQLRGRCPLHDGRGDRDFVVTPSKGLWYCFAGCGGGDQIKLVAKAKGIDQREAANLIDAHFGGTVPARNSNSSPGTVPGTAPQNQKAGRTCPTLDYLQPEHESVQGLGVSKATADALASGYSPKGIMRGRYACPIHDPHGTLLAYVGIAVSPEQSPKLLYPNGFDPSSVIWNAHRVGGGELFLVRDPLAAILAIENGIALESVVAFLGDITPQSLEMLSSLMDERRIERVEMF